MSRLRIMAGASRKILSRCCRRWRDRSELLQNRSLVIRLSQTVNESAQRAAECSPWRGEAEPGENATLNRLACEAGDRGFQCHTQISPTILCTQQKSQRR